MDEEVKQRRTRLAESIRNGTDPTESILGLIQINCPLNEKFTRIKGFSELLIKNSETSEGLKRLLMMLNILEKYGRHLLKPADQRSSMWRHIKNSNTIYRDRVARIWGGPLIMQMMGYTEDRDDGVAFPEGSEPNHAMILELVGDIILGRKELELYLAGTHPYPQFIEEHLSQKLLSVLKQTSIASNRDVNTSASPSRKQQPKSVASGTHSQLPATLGSLKHSSGSPKGQSLENEVNAAQQSDMEAQNENRAQSLVCDICGKNQADIVCNICDNKQLCVDCDTKWHSHPKRLNHQRQKLGLPQGPGSTQDPQPQGLASTPAPQACGGIGAGEQQGQQAQLQKRIVLGELPQGEGDNVYSPPGQQNTPPPLSTSQHIYQTLIRPGTGPSMLYEPMIYGQIPSSSAAHVPSSVTHTPLMYQPQYPPQHISNQPRMVPAIWPGSQPGSSQYFSHQMLGTGQIPRSGHVTGDSHMTGHSHIPGAHARVGQSVQYPYSLAGGFRTNQEVRSSSQGGYPADMNQSHTLAYFPASYAVSTPSPVSSDPLSMPRYQAPSPQGQGDIGFHGNQIRPVSPGVYQNKQKNIDKTYEAPVKTDSSLKRTTSHLVLKLQAIPNLEKRRSRLDINVATLKEEIEELDERINQIIVENETFIQDHEYNRLSKQKQKYLRDIQELEKYELELDRMITENVNEDLTGKETIVQKVPGDTNRQCQGPQNKGYSVGSVKFPPDTANPPDVIGSHPNILAYQNRENNYLLGGQTSGGSANQKLPVHNSANEEEENFRNAEEEKKMNEIRKMLLLGQNPFGQKPTKQEPLGLNIPFSEANIDTLQQKPLLGEGITYPPQIIISGSSDVQTQQKVEDFAKMMMQHNALNEHSGLLHKASEPNLRVKSNESERMRKVSSDSDLQLWECEHCTFVNEHSSNVCSVCYKTNDNKKIIGMGLKEKEAFRATAVGSGDSGMGGASGQGDGASGQGGGDSTVAPCKKCTFHNKEGQEKCQMCGETLILVTEPLKIDVGGGEKTNLGVPVKPGSAENKKEAASPRVTSLEQKLEEEQDQVFLEKKLAQQKFKENQEATAKRGNTAQTPGMGSQQKSEKTPTTGEDESSFVFVEPGSSLLLTEGVPLQAGYIGPKKVLNKKLASLQKTPQGSPPSSNEEFFITPPASMMEMGPTPAGGHSIDRRPPANVNFNEAIEHIQMRRAQEQMSLDGHDYVMLLKAAEKEGYILDELEIAVAHCVDDKMKPLDWLKQKWAELSEAVIDMVSQLANQNDDVGELSKAEAKEELIKSKGDIKKAADACMKSRREKFKEISNEGEYSRENILTALYQNEGNVEATIDQLNSYVIKGISDHVWVEPGADCGEGADGPQRALVRAEGGVQGLPLIGAGLGAVGGQGSEVSDGSTDSIIGNEGFQDMIKDRDVNRERRIRTILVEAKLQSWGRAETVIIILDTESHHLEDVFDCSLDDIIEAVKNCGDRKRSLAYLKQECGICFSCYPMNKIQSLNSCQCKLCRYCLKQNFEVAIREKYVRNWACPLCQAPNLEDEIAAQSYFEFLQMLLRTLVDDEIKDLFETKIRDWHLQKEVNFRWCAHCASGFVWDRPNVMGMTCPSCNKKTCFMCKKKWEDQHQGLTCEEFTQWKIDNDPNFQAVGLARHLEENGIDCPSCKMRYDLAKGGCMHFRCPQCGHEFCSGCSEPFMQDGTCKLMKECKGKGLHCHHPRDCFYYLRDNDVTDLQALLKQSKVQYNTEIPPTQRDPRHCPVMEQKEYGANKKDEACGKDTQKGMAGLCQIHYKEYLVGLINKNKLDPVDIMGVRELDRCFARMGKLAPKLNKNENEPQYKLRLAKLVRENFPLRR